ncbi:hypothetical protein [Streptomyces canus]
MDKHRTVEAITDQANTRAEVFRARVEAAIKEHFTQAHPGR